MDDFIDIDLVVEEKRRILDERIHGTTDVCDLRVLISLYHCAPRIFYVDYMADYKRLVSWLGRPPKTTISYPSIPDALCSYTVNRLANILDVSPNEIFYTTLEIYKDNNALTS